MQSILLQANQLAIFLTGYKTIDYNEEDKGFSHIQLTVDSKGRRSNAANSFLYPFAFQR